MLVNILEKSRYNFIKITDDTSIGKLNVIPDGFNNNILWNFSHVVATQQLLCYKLSGLEFPIKDDTFIDEFRKGTKPERTYSKADLDLTKKYSQIAIEALTKDLELGAFKAFQSYETSFGIILEQIEQAIVFSNLHEGLHLGYVMAQKRVL